MNGGMVVFGLLTCVMGVYLARNPESEVDRGLRWRGFDSRAIDLADHTQAVERVRYVGVAILSMGLLMATWGVLDWSGDLLAGVLVLGSVGALLLILVATT